VGLRLAERLAALPPIGYDRVRESEAEKLGIRRSTVDEEVEKYKIVPGSAIPDDFHRSAFWYAAEIHNIRSHKYYPRGRTRVTRSTCPTTI
jgi:hypothetical protein